MASTSLAATNQQANSDLLRAAKTGDESKVAEALAQPGVDVNCCDNDGRTPLLLAIKRKDLSVFRLLLKNSSVEVNARDAYEQTVLHRWTQEDLVEILLSYRREVDVDWNAADKIGQTPLLRFARKGDDKDPVRRLIGVESVDLFATTIDGFTALHQVAERETPFPDQMSGGHISERCKIVELMLEEVGRRGHEVVRLVDATDILNRSALHYIAEEGCIEILELLCMSSANMSVNGVDFHGFTPLHLAVRNGHDAVVERLLKLQSIDANVPATVNASNPNNLKPFEKADISVECCRPNLFLKRPKEQPSRNLTPLHFAAMNGRREAVRQLLKWKDIKIDAVDSAGLTPLQYSVQNSHWEVVELLLEKRNPSATLNIDAVDSEGRTPLQFAVMNRRMAVVRLLLEREGINIDAVDRAGLTPLQYSVQNGHWEVVELLLTKGKPTLNIDAVDSEGRTPLQDAIRWGPMEVVRLLLEREGINIDAVDSTGSTPLHSAIAYGRMEVVRLLLEREGINIYAVDSEGRTPLHLAIWCWQIELVRLLLEREGINIDAVDSEGRTPLHFAIEIGSMEVVKLIVEREGINIDAVDSTGRTPLRFAIEGGSFPRLEVVRLLLEREGINIDAVDRAGLTPLQYSVQNSHWEVVELLLEKGKPFAKLDYHRQCGVFEKLLHLATKREEKTIAIQLLNTLGSRMNDFADRSTKFTGNQSLSDQSRLLASAALSNHFEIIKYIVKWQPEVNVNETSECAAIPDLVATPLHFAAVGGDVATVGGPKRGHVEAVQELLEHPKLDVNAQDNKKNTPLLYAIEARNVDMVKVLCQNDKFQRLRATEENSDGHTLLQIVVEANNLSEDPDLKAMEKVLLERSEVKDFVDRLYRDRQVFVDAANALLVGAALIASVTFAGWLQPPLGYTPYYDFSQPFPAPPGAYESYAAIKQNPKVKVFWVFNSLSFFFAIATVLAGADAAMPSLDDAFIARVVKSVRRSLIVASILLVMSVVCVLGAFTSGGFAVLPPLLKYDTSMIITVCVGGTVCMIILAKFLWKLAKASRVRLLKRAMKHCTLVEGGHCSPTCIGNGS